MDGRTMTVDAAASADLGGGWRDLLRRIVSGVAWALVVHHACQRAATRGPLDGDVIRRILHQADDAR